MAFKLSLFLASLLIGFCVYLICVALGLNPTMSLITALVILFSFISISFMS